MKNFFKKVAFVLALAMVLTNIGPAATASAAEAPGLKWTSKIIYVGGSAFGDYTESCWTPSKNTDGYEVTYSTNSKIIDLNTKNGKITANGTGVGLAVVNVTYTPVGGGQATTAAFNVKVRRNATDVKLAQATINDLKLDEGLSVGAEVTLKAAKSATTSKSYATGNFGWDNYRGIVTDQVDYEISNPDVIKVEGNVLTAVGAGVATLKVFAYEYLDKTKTPVVYKEYTITVLGGILDVKQTTLKKVAVEMGMDMSDALYTDFTITNVDTTSNVAIKDISISDDKKTVTIETFVEMRDSANYEVKYAKGEEVYAKSFVATSGEVVGIKLNTETIPADKSTEIKATLVDANNVSLATVKSAALSDNGYNTSFEYSSFDGYQDGNNIIIFEVGKTAQLTVTYYTGKYNDDGVEFTVSQTFTIRATDEKATASGLKNVLKDADDKDIDWDSITAGSAVTVYAEDSTENGKAQWLYVYRTDSWENDLTQANGYYLESSNVDKLIITSQSFAQKGKGIIAYISAVSSGSAQILVKDGDGKLVGTISVTINAKRAFRTFNLDTTSLTLSNSNLIGEDHVKKVTVTPKDQYNKDMGVEDTISISTSSSNLELDKGITIGTGKDNNKIIIDPKGKTPGTYQIRVTYKGVTKTISVTIQEPIGTVTYKIISSGTSYNTAWEEKDDNKGNAEIKVGIYKNNVLYTYADLTSSEVKKDGVVITKTSSVTGGAITTVSGGVTIPVHNVCEGTLYKASSGNYSVTVKYMKDGAETSLNTSFRVEDKQKAMTIRQAETSASTGAIDAMIKEAFNFYYAGDKVGDEDNIKILTVYSPNAGDKDATSYGAGQVAITKVDLQYKIDGTWVTFYGVAVGKTIRVN